MRFLQRGAIWPFLEASRRTSSAGSGTVRVQACIKALYRPGGCLGAWMKALSLQEVAVAIVQTNVLERTKPLLQRVSQHRGRGDPIPDCQDHEDGQADPGEPPEILCGFLDFLWPTKN